MEIEELWQNIKGELGNLEKRMDAKMDTKLSSLEKSIDSKLQDMEENAIEREKGIEERAIKREKVMEEKINQKFETINLNIAKILEEQVRTTQEVKEVKRALKENEIENKKLDVRVSNLELKVSGF